MSNLAVLLTIATVLGGAVLAWKDGALRHALGDFHLPLFVAASAVAVLTFLAAANLPWLFDRRWRLTVPALTASVLLTANWLGFLVFRLGRLLLNQLLGAA